VLIPFDFEFKNETALFYISCVLLILPTYVAILSIHYYVYEVKYPNLILYFPIMSIVVDILIVIFIIALLYGFIFFILPKKHVIDFVLFLLIPTLGLIILEKRVLGGIKRICEKFNKNSSKKLPLAIVISVARAVSPFHN